MPPQNAHQENAAENPSKPTKPVGQSGRTPQGSTRVMMVIPTDLLKTVEDLAKADYMTRSDVIRRALTDYVRRTDNLEKLATPITGQDVVLQRFLDKYREQHPDSR